MQLLLSLYYNLDAYHIGYYYYHHYSCSSAKSC